LALYALFVLLPAINALRYSLLRWDGLGPGVFVGAKNFVKLLGPGSDFPVALQHNLYLTVAPGVIILPLALFFAWTIHQGARGARVFRIAFFFPNVISSVAIALLWQLIYTTAQPGLINGLLHLWHPHSQPVPFTKSDRLLQSLVPMIVWSATGFYMVLFLAAMESIPPSYYEAARLDGAGSWTQFRHVTLPLMWDVLTTGILFLLIGGLKTFDSIWVMESGRPTNFTHTLSTLMYQRVFVRYEIGAGSAIAVLLFVLSLAVTLIGRRLMQREALEY
jgi:ABC-type sugar transport system permease subunit